MSYLGKRVEVKWTQPNANGWFNGTVVDFDEITKKLFVKYDIPDEESGQDTYGENLLGATGPEWKFLKETEPTKKPKTRGSTLAPKRK